MVFSGFIKYFEVQSVGRKKLVATLTALRSMFIDFPFIRKDLSNKFFFQAFETHFILTKYFEVQSKHKFFKKPMIISIFFMSGCLIDFAQQGLLESLARLKRFP
jgi:hypothetical protein